MSAKLSHLLGLQFTNQLYANTEGCPLHSGYIKLKGRSYFYCIKLLDEISLLWLYHQFQHFEILNLMGEKRKHLTKERNTDSEKSLQQQLNGMTRRSISRKFCELHYFSHR